MAFAMYAYTKLWQPDVPDKHLVIGDRIAKVLDIPSQLWNHASESSAYLSLSITS